VLTEDVALVRYRTTRHDDTGQHDSISLRSSVWVRRANRWQMLFHQATTVAAPELDADDVLGYAPEVDPTTGKSTGGMIVLLKDGSEKRYRREDLQTILPILKHVTPPTA